MALEGDSPIASRTRLCWAKLEALCEKLPHPELTGNNVANIFDAPDQRDRFKIWAGNMGALQDIQFHTSLDYRLREAPRVVALITELLGDLEEALEEAITTASCDSETLLNKGRERSLSDSCISLNSDAGEEDYSASSDGISEDGDTLDSIADIISSLFKTSMMVRNATPRDRYAKAATALNPFSDQFDIAHVTQKFPKLKNWLRDRLGKAITHRRQYLRYCEEHHNALKKQLSAEAPNHVSTTNTVIQPQHQMPRAAPIAYSGSHLGVSELADTLPLTKASTLVASHLEKAEDPSDDLTQTSYATSVAGEDDGSGKLRVIPIQEVSRGRTAFECPYCWGIQNSKTQKAWKKHVYNDLRPYLCTFEQCDLKMFSSRQAWFSHELQCHRLDWCCQLCSRKYDIQDKLERHVRSCHANNLTEAQIPALLNAGQQPVDRIPVNECPFCDAWGARLKEANPGLSELFVTPAQFRSHVASHMEQLALFAIPRGSLEGDEAESSAAAVAIGDRPSEANSDDQTNQSMTLPAMSVNGDPPLHIAAFEGNASEVKELLKSGEDINSRGRTWRSALRAATIQGNARVVEILIAHGADEDPQELCHIARNKGHEVILRMLCAGFKSKHLQNSAPSIDKINTYEAAQIHAKSASDLESDPDTDSNPEDPDYTTGQALSNLLSRSDSEQISELDSEDERRRKDASTYLQSLLRIINGDPSRDLDNVIAHQGELVKGTCEWVLQSEPFRNWMSSATSLLWISGDPGTGKTILAIYIMKEIARILPSMPNRIMLSSFVGDNAIMILWRLIYQLLVLQPALFRLVLTKPAVDQDALEKTLRDYSFGMVWGIFEEMITNHVFEDIYCVLDGLDMCEQQSLACFMNKLQGTRDGSSHMKLLVVLRESVPNIQNAMSSFANISLNPSVNRRLAEDLRLYISAKVRERAVAKNLPASLQKPMERLLLLIAKKSFTEIDRSIQECFDLTENKNPQEAALALLTSLTREDEGVEAENIRPRSGNIGIVKNQQGYQINENASERKGSTTSHTTSSSKYQFNLVADDNMIRDAQKEEIPSIISPGAFRQDINARTHSSEHLEPFQLVLPSLGSDRVDFRELTEQGTNENDQGNFLLAEFLLAAQDSIDISPNLKDTDGNTVLHRTIDSGNEELAMKICHRLISDHAEGINAVNNVGETPLHLASSKGMGELVELLLGFGASVDGAKFPNQTSTPLCNACRNGNWSIVSSLLRKGAEAAVKQSDGTTPLHSAAFLGSEEIVRLLIESGAEVECPDANGHTALFIAGKTGNVKVAQVLVEIGASYEKALLSAVKAGSQDAISWILNSGVDCNSACEGTTALQLAAAIGDAAMVSFLIQQGAIADVVHPDQEPALHLAILHEHPDAAKVLLAEGANVNLPARHGRTALHISAQEGRLDAIQLLLDSGAWVDSQSDAGDTPLHDATFFRMRNAVQLLLKHGATPNHRTKRGETPLCVAAGNGDVQIMELLLDAGAVPDQENGAGCTALHVASSFGRTKAIDLLIQRGADINRANQLDEGKTALHYSAAQTSEETAVQRLLDQGIPIEISDSHGRTALYTAAAQGNVSTVNLLLECGANASSRDEQGQTAIHEAAKNGHEPTVRRLIHLVASSSLFDNKMKTPLHLAAHHGHFDVVSRLRAEGADIDLPDYRGRTPLHHAARGGHVDSVQFLLKYGTSPSLRDSKGLTPLHLATRKGQVKVVECLLASMSVEDVGILSREQGTARDVAKKKGNKEIVKLIDKVVSPMDNRTGRVGDVWDNERDNERDSEDEHGHKEAPYFYG